MIEFQYLEVKNRPQFKDQRFDLTKPGVNLVLGFNKKTGSNNGVGKSLFFSELADFLAEDSISGTKQDRVRKGSVKFGVKRGDVLYECEREFSPREKISVYKNGTDMGIRELSAARQFIRDNVIPYGEQEVVSYLYLDLANGAHPLVTGTTSTRKQFFRSFFKQIDELSTVRKMVDVEVSKRQDSARRLEELKSTIDVLKSAVPEDLEEQKATLASLQSQLASIQEESSSISRAVTLREALASMEVPEKYQVSSEELDRMDKAARAKAKSARDLIAKIEEYTEWLEQNKQIRDQLKLIEEQCGDEEVSEEQLKSAEEKRDSLQARLTGFRKNCRLLRDSITSASEELKACEHRVKHLSEEAGTCPTCGQDYDNVGAKKKLKIEKSRVRELNEQIAQDSAALEKLESSSDKEDVVAQRIEKLDLGVTKLESLLKAQSTRRRLLRQIEDKKDKPESLDVVSLQGDLQRVTKARTNIEKARSRALLLDEWNALPKAVRSASSKSDSIMQKVVQITEKISDLRVVVAEASLRQSDLREKIAERKALKSDLVNLEEFQVLQQAFSRKGVEKELITSACSMLEDQVNRYAKHVFAEDFEFSFDLETNFEITVKRKYGKRVEESDVRKLSGAEKRLFSLVLLMALLSFVPKKDRSSLLILDEPTATMGEDNKANFVRFLPVLNTVIPNIVVITPLEPKDYTHIQPRVFTVVKDGALSKIEEGIINGATLRNIVQQPKLAGRGSSSQSNRDKGTTRLKK